MSGFTRYKNGSALLTLLLISSLLLTGCLDGIAFETETGTFAVSPTASESITETAVLTESPSQAETETLSIPSSSETDTETSVSESEAATPGTERETVTAVAPVITTIASEATTVTATAPTVAATTAEETSIASTETSDTTVRDPGTEYAGGRPAAAHDNETEQQILERVGNWISYLPLPGGKVYTQTAPPAAAEPVPPVYDPYWRYDEDETRRTIMLLIEEALDQGQLSVDIAPALEGMVIADEAEFKLKLDALVFTVKEGNPEYFYYENMIYTYYYYYDVEGGRSYIEYLIEFNIKPEYQDEEVRAKEWQRLDFEAYAVAEAIMNRTQNDWQRLRLAHDYLTVKNFYSPDADVATNNVVSGLRGEETMCVGYAQAFQMIANRMGYPTYNIYGYANNEAHDWNIVQLNGVWYHVDVTFDDPINNDYPAPLVQTSYFLRSDSAMAQTHRIDSYNVPSAPEDFLANYINEGTLAADRDSLIQTLVSYMNERDLYDEIPDVMEFFTDGFTLSYAEFDQIMTEVFEHVSDYPYYFYLINGEVGTIYFTFDA